jgi:RNA polymerase sigma factor (sigma-70 family)
MTVVLRDIDAQKRRGSSYENESEMYTLSEYLEIAQKCISRFSFQENSIGMLNDESAVSHVAEHIMWGHLRWKKDGGRSLKSYLCQCAIWAMKVWKTKTYQVDQKKQMSLNYELDGDGGNQQYEITPDPKLKEPFELIYNDANKNANEMINKSNLTDIQKKCMKERYIDGKKLQEIASSLAVSKQAINQHIKRALKKMRGNENVICK